jgi:FtsP/CotA-like multicopper oxidase with cupredoxin domain
MIGTANWIVEGAFDRPLVVPGVLSGGGILAAKASSFQMTRRASASTLSYQDGILGPTIKAEAGVSVNVELKNLLSEPTNIHWHGLVLPENMDGHPKDVASAGATINYVLPINQRAGTYWYHPHPHGSTARQVFMGLAGMFIVSDTEEKSLNLPSGSFEIPLIIQDKHFSGSELDYSPTRQEVMSGYLGEQILVNGIHAPFVNVQDGWYRLRVLNGSTARVFNLALSNGMEFFVIGGDGGLLASPEPTSSLLLGPGERADLVINFASVPLGADIFLVSEKFSRFDIQGRQGYRIMKFHIDRAATNNFSLPSSLSHITPIASSSAVATRTFDIAATTTGGHGDSTEGHSINGKMFEMERVDEIVKAGSTEIWEFDNHAGDEIHPMHIHGVQFQVLERIGGRGKLIPTEKGWKDTILLMPGEKVRVIMTFPQYTGIFVLHCHNLEHEDDGMMLNYRIE